jgi:hypothetical protein
MLHAMPVGHVQEKATSMLCHMGSHVKEALPLGLTAEGPTWLFVVPGACRSWGVMLLVWCWRQMRAAR